MIITYNGRSTYTEKINDEHCIRVGELVRLSVNPPSSIYVHLSKIRDSLTGEVIKPSHRVTYITLDGCVKLLSCMRNPDDGLIKVLKEALNHNEVKNENVELKPNAETIVDIELDRLKKEKAKDDLKERDKDAKIDSIYKVVKEIDLRLINIEYIIQKMKNEEGNQICEADIGHLVAVRNNWWLNKDHFAYGVLMEIKNEGDKTTYVVGGNSNGFDYCRRLTKQEIDELI